MGLVVLAALVFLALRGAGESAWQDGFRAGASAQAIRGHVHPDEVPA